MLIVEERPDLKGAEYCQSHTQSVEGSLGGPFQTELPAIGISRQGSDELLLMCIVFGGWKEHLAAFISVLLCITGARNHGGNDERVSTVGYC